MQHDVALSTQEIEERNRQLSSLEERTSNLNLTSPADVEIASVLLKEITETENALIARKEEITRPIMAGLASVRTLFKGPETKLANTKKALKSKMLAYDEAHRPVEETPKEEKVKTRTLIKVRVVDVARVPRKFMVPNLPMITTAILHEGIKVPGAESYKEKSVVN